MAPFSSICGLPLCLSEITTNSLAFSKQIADHDQRRKGLKKLKVQQVIGECFWPLDQATITEIWQDQEVIILTSNDFNSGEEEEEVAGDLAAGVVTDFSCLSLMTSCTANAA